MYITKAEGSRVYNQAQNAAEGRHEFQAVREIYLRLISDLIQSYLRLMRPEKDDKDEGAYFSRSQNSAIDGSLNSVQYQTKDPKNKANYRGSDIADLFSPRKDAITYQRPEDKSPMYRRPEGIDLGLHN